MKKRVSPGARRAIILIQTRSISRLETAFGRCDLCRLANSVRDLGRLHLRELKTLIRRRGLSNRCNFRTDQIRSGRFDLSSTTMYALARVLTRLLPSHQDGLPVPSS